MTKVKIIFTIGVGQDTDGNEITQSQFSKNRLQSFKAVAACFGGYTARETLGGWIDDAGKLIEEKSIQIECLAEFTTIEVAQRQSEIVAKSLCALWNQNCIVLEVVQCSYSFINQDV